MNVLLKARLAGEIVRDYVKVRRALRRQSLPAVLSSLRGRATRTSLDTEVDGRRLARAVVRTLAPLPVDSRCLMRSLVLVGVLARRGVTGQLVIAVRPDQRDGLGAHAWVEVQGEALLAPAADHGRLVTM